jgi:hypothetical protein
LLSSGLAGFLGALNRTRGDGSATKVCTLATVKPFLVLHRCHTRRPPIAVGGFRRCEALFSEGTPPKITPMSFDMMFVHGGPAEADTDGNHGVTQLIRKWLPGSCQSTAFSWRLMS